MDSVPTIALKNLTKDYNGKKALDSVSFELSEEESIAILGENGSGKSTLLNIVAGILEQSTGSVRVYGKSPTDREVKQLRSVVFQEQLMDADLTGKEILIVHGMLYGMGRKERGEKAEELLKFMDLDGYQDKLIKTYSVGMKRRLILARALMHMPKILLLDEPTSGLDPSIKKKVWDYLSKFRKKFQLTLLLITQDMEEAITLGDKIMIMKDGKSMLLTEKENIDEKIKTVIILKSNEFERIEKIIKNVDWEIRKIRDKEIMILAKDRKEEVNARLFKLLEGVEIEKIDVDDIKLSDFITWWSK